VLSGRFESQAHGTGGKVLIKAFAGAALQPPRALSTRRDQPGSSPAQKWAAPLSTKPVQIDSSPRKWKSGINSILQQIVAAAPVVDALHALGELTSPAGLQAL
jgi:hypothetical protein